MGAGQFTQRRWFGGSIRSCKRTAPLGYTCPLINAVYKSIHCESICRRSCRCNTCSRKRVRHSSVSLESACLIAWPSDASVGAATSCGIPGGRFSGRPPPLVTTVGVPLACPSSGTKPEASSRGPSGTDGTTSSLAIRISRATSRWSRRPRMRTGTRMRRATSTIASSFGPEPTTVNVWYSSGSSRARARTNSSQPFSGANRPAKRIPFRASRPGIGRLPYPLHVLLTPAASQESQG